MARNPDSALQQVVTLAMVAEAAGVSPSTVSRILTGHARVSDDKRKSVEDAIAQLKYEPNVLARGLAQGRTLSIGVLTQDINSPFYGEALRGIEDALAGTGIVPLFVSGHWNVQDEAERMAHLLSRRVDGIVVLTGRLTDEQIREYAKRVPIVVTGRNLKGHNIASMRVDDFKGAYRATQHLIELGHRRIAHIAGPQDHADSVERVKGYRKALDEAGVAFDARLVAYADFHEPSGVLAINQLIDARQQFTAVFASNDQTAYGARLALYQRNIRVPEDVSLIGFDDLPGSRYVIPPLSTIHQPVYELGQAAARVLLKLIEGGRSRVTLPEPQLVARESTRRLQA
ncbi:LacI family DNA-binding transcriptional regulator [Piscinibacter sp.]|uniref:LacI family DNA-binding transcriptional regulator n=1 Tax=Piscinibacter sp. TaxID=1903157 RepID=UPI002CA9B99E|nr:substrate-binding domain-containing protein [Albitalea sp.]HUG23446.1 substrate-binding domain-containing protein [Albitalea sp.]